jgi:TonB family protein
LETIIIIIIERDGKIQKWWFEKKSGSALYDQSAMRAIKKAEPLPSLPKELNKDILEFGILFRSD